MSQTQSYIGIKNGVVVCVNSYTGFDLEGEFYHGYSTEPVAFSGAGELLKKLESLFDLLNFPIPATNERDFSQGTAAGGKTFAGGGSRRARVIERPYQVKRDTGERIRVMSDKDILSKHGDEGTFIIRVQQRQNSSWQGRITWVDEDKTVYFRSAWEMMKLIDAALETKEKADNEKNVSTWE